MTTEYVERMIEEQKQSRYLPKDFEITEIAYWPDMKDVPKRVVGYGHGDPSDKDKGDTKGYDIYVWLYEFGVLVCHAHRWQWSDNMEPVSIRWNEEAQRPEHVDLVKPWSRHSLLDIREPRRAFASRVQACTALNHKV